MLRLSDRPRGRRGVQRTVEGGETPTPPSKAKPCCKISPPSQPPAPLCRSGSCGTSPPVFRRPPPLLRPPSFPTPPPLPRSRLSAPTAPRAAAPQRWVSRRASDGRAGASEGAGKRSVGRCGSDGGDGRRANLNADFRRNVKLTINVTRFRRRGLVRRTSCRFFAN